MRPTWAPMRDILRVGAASSIVSLSTNITIATATGLAGLVGPAAVAGYGAGVRLEYLLVPLVFGLGTPVAAMVGTSIGAGRRERALRVAWTGAAIAAGLTEAIGLAAACFPAAWLSLFSRDAQMIEVGTSYLRIVGPFYGFFGGGLALYFASQGAGQVSRPMMFAVLRVIIAVAGGWMIVAEFGGSQGLFAVLAFALVFYGLGQFRFRRRRRVVQGRREGAGGAGARRRGAASGALKLAHGQPGCPASSRASRRRLR